MKHIAVTFKLADTTQAEIIIALLANAGFEGFEEGEDELKAFVSKTAFDQNALDVICSDLKVSYTLEEMEQQNWNARWESSFDPVIINDFAAVRAGFHAPVTTVRHEIIITPKMSFGTGHHATTYLMMEQMNGVEFGNKTVFDFGTGTGVLAILAEKMGAAAIYAIDNDDWSIENTKENISANNCRHITAEKAEAPMQGRQFDIILANINLNVLQAGMPAIAAACKPGTVVLFSGILAADELLLATSANAAGLTFSSVNERNGWLCIKAVYSPLI